MTHARRRGAAAALPRPAVLLPPRPCCACSVTIEPDYVQNDKGDSEINLVCTATDSTGADGGARRPLRHA